MAGCRAGEGQGEAGATLLELLIVAGLAVSLLAMALPLTARAADTSRARAASAYIAAQVRQARLEAVSENLASAIVFDRHGSSWLMRRCGDGNGNGVRRAEIATGVDACRTVPQPLRALFPGVELTLGAGIPGVEEPAGNTSGVRFGRSDMVSCSPVGHCTPGTLYVRSEGGQQFAVRVAGVSGRTRLLRFDTATGSWNNDQ